MTLPLRMELTLRSFLLFLRKLESFFRRRWDQSTRGLWYIFLFMRSCFSSRHSKKGDVIRRSIKSRPANPPTTVISICASGLPPPRDDSGTPVITSPGPISTQVRQPTTSSDGGSLSYTTPEDQSAEHRGVDSYFLGEGRQVSPSPDSVGHDENEYTHVIVPQIREDFTSDSPVTPSRPPSQYSYRQSHHTRYPPPSQRPSSVYSYRSTSHLNDAEAAARGYLRAPPSSRPSSPAHSVRPPSITGSVTSRVYRASAHRGVHEVPPEVPPLPQSEPRISVSTHPDLHGMAVSSRPVLNLQGRLRPMIGIDRYEKHKRVVAEDEIHTHISPPVTTQFVL